MDPIVSSDRTVGIAALVARLERSRASIHRDIKRGDCPRPLRLAYSSRWLVSEVDAFLVEKARARFD